jgi:adenylyltransferase/sulfurtransferase
MSLSPEELERYARQMVIPDVGEEGQIKLKQASVLIVGLGGLGSPAALYLAGAGVGRLSLLEDDSVSLSNLQRQILYGAYELNMKKTVAASIRLNDLNRHLRIEAKTVRLSEANAGELVDGYDLILGCVDNRETRFLLNKTAYAKAIPWIDGAVIRSLGTVMTYLPPKGACYACLHYDETEESDPAKLGVWGAAAGVIGSLQAMEAIKYLLGEREDLLLNRMLWCDFKTMQMMNIAMEKRKECDICQA